MRKIILLAVAMLFLFLPFVAAFDCNSLNGGDFDICKSIQQNPELTSQEKDLLIADIFNPNKTFPNHDFVYMWNTALDIRNSPDNKYTSQGVIKNAWVKIITPMPSVLENDILYVPERGKLMSKYDYDVILPSGTVSGDCRTKYYLINQDEDLDIFLNRKLIGHNKLNSFYANTDDLDFKAGLNIKVEYKIKHYRNKRYCSEYDENGRCIRHYTRCEYRSTEYETDTLKLTDNFNAKLYKQNPTSDFKITNKYYGTTEGEFQANNYSSFVLSFQDSSFERTNYVYSLAYSLPYYVLTIKADKIENSKINNIRILDSGDKFEFAVKNTNNCKISLYNHFRGFSRNCDLTYNEIDLKIKTDKLNYNENETIQVELFPKDVLIELSYANQSVKAKDRTEFKAVLNKNKIIAKLNDSETLRIINVTDSKNKKLAIDLSSLSLFGYVIYSFLRKYPFSFI